MTSPTRAQLLGSLSMLVLFVVLAAPAAAVAPRHHVGAGSRTDTASAPDVRLVAADGDAPVPSLDVAIDVDARGDLHITETIDYVPWPQYHGIDRWLRSRTRSPGSAPDRLYPVSDVTVSSLSGASVPAAVKSGVNFTTVRFGDTQRYDGSRQISVLRYTVRGAFTRTGVPSPDGSPLEPRDELSWDVGAPYWNVPIGRVAVRVTAPQPPVTAHCHRGFGNPTEQCTATAGPSPTFSAHGQLQTQDMTVVLAYPAGTVTAPGPVMAPERLERVSSAITDQVNALGRDTSRVHAALDRLEKSSGIRLRVLVTDTFGSDDAEHFTNVLYRNSNLALQDGLLVVAVEEFHPWLTIDTDAFPLSDSLVDGVMDREVEPRIQARDWAGAVIALADGLRAPYLRGDRDALGHLERAMSLTLLIGGVALAGVTSLVVRRRRHAAGGTAGSEPPRGASGGAVVTRVSVFGNVLLAVQVVVGPSGAIGPLDVGRPYAGLVLVGVISLLWSAADGRSVPVATWAGVETMIIFMWWVQQLAAGWARPHLFEVSGFYPGMFRDVASSTSVLYVLATPFVFAFFLMLTLIGGGIGRLRDRPGCRPSPATAPK